MSAERKSCISATSYERNCTLCLNFYAITVYTNTKNTNFEIWGTTLAINYKRYCGFFLIFFSKLIAYLSSQLQKITNYTATKEFYNSITKSKKMQEFFQLTMK